MASDLNLAVIRAVGKDGSTYRARRADKGWPSVRKIENAYRRAYNKVDDLLEAAMNEAARRSQPLDLSSIDRLWAQLTVEQMTFEMAAIGVRIEVL
jgi:hypothetical protein